jgi:hypothetical protein
MTRATMVVDAAVVGVRFIEPVFAPILKCGRDESRPYGP